MQLLIILINVDLPTEGRPTLILGAGFSCVEKALLPLPPLPPWATTNLSPGTNKSAITKPLSKLVTVVPIGTFITTSSALAPFLLEPCPLVPLLPLICFIIFKSINVFNPGSTSKIILEPLPPLPPLGPPISIYFSLLNDVQPSPPLPAVIKTVTSSANIGIPPFNLVQLLYNQY